MPRWLSIVLITSLVIVSAGVAFAQEGETPQYGGRLARFRSEQRQLVPPAEVLIYERAHRLAQQRQARLETYRWLGYSPNRPTIPFSSMQVDQNPGLYRPWTPLNGGFRAGW